jgi:hypothetical protein
MDALLKPPLPPIEYRRLVAPTDEKDWLNDSGALFVDGLTGARPEGGVGRLDPRAQGSNGRIPTKR